MKNLLLIAITTAAMSSAQALEFDPEFYAGSSYATWQFSQSNPNINSTLSIYSLEGIGGVKILPYISFEARVGAGLNSDKENLTRLDIIEDEEGNPVVVEVPDGSIEVAMEYFASIYFRPVIENEKASLYGLLGYTTATFDAEPADTNSEDTQSGLSYGVGASFVVNKRADVFIEWKKLINADAISMRGGSVGFTYKF